jgi:hypothetical protein
MSSVVRCKISNSHIDSDREDAVGTLHAGSEHFSGDAEMSLEAEDSELCMCRKKGVPKWNRGEFCQGVRVGFSVGIQTPRWVFS